ncbi:hypothetical protein H5410_038250 [Solanum commersonii]|uniref:Wound-responsive family protein n=1 Tax=Solanum commersonii TaxID=4109 RepID=A0A9J5YA72_SOLCO|nr:hypothetical protein H5410_038250 [Solanum commersonii]
MSSSRRAWIVAASVGAVEALKDQVGLCRWDYPLKCLAQHTKNNMRSYSQAKKLSSLIAKSEKAEQSEESLRKKMSSTSRAWVTAVSLGVVEALKDQGVCRWNYTIRAINQHAKNNLRSYSHAKKLSSQSSSSSSLVSANKLEVKKVKKSEESLRKVMYLSCWGPN